MTQPLAAVAEAREAFLALVSEIRPELHRYCARLTGSVIDGEDLVQETLAKGLYALSLATEVPPLRPWLFRIAHNAAMDLLKSHAHRYTDSYGEMDEVVGFEDAADPLVVRAALACFLTLPVIQRSAVILKDVLGHSLEETAETMGTSVMAVKAALVRGRGALRVSEATVRERSSPSRADLERYASRFNARDWDGVRALVSDDCRLDLVSKATRRGREVGAYFGRYEKEGVTLRVGELEGQLVLFVTPRSSASPSYVIIVEMEDGRLTNIRDFRYVPYILGDAQLTAGE